MWNQIYHRLSWDQSMSLLHQRETYKNMNMDESYPHMFELLWYSQLPCFDIVNITTKSNQDHGRNLIWLIPAFFHIIGLNHSDSDHDYHHQFAPLGMIKECWWKGKRLSCSSIFTKIPTDRGMCCSFNKQKAEEMFKESRYQHQLKRLNDQDKRLSFEKSTVPDW